MNELLEAAQAYASRGWRVFPVHGIVDGRCSCDRECSSPGKHPLVRRGLHEATKDEYVIREWWTRSPFANVGIATGRVVVIDIDGPEGEASVRRLEDLGLRLSPTLTALTGNGQHLYFACDRELRNTTRCLPGIEEDLPGVDLRARGGYVVAPPSTHANGTTYQWVDSEVDLAPLPDWIKAPERHAIAVPSRRPPTLTGDGTPYGVSALLSEITILIRTPVGSRNDQLNKAAFSMGQLVAGGHLVEAFAYRKLMGAALTTGLGAREALATIRSGVAAGRMRPRKATAIPLSPRPCHSR